MGQFQRDLVLGIDSSTTACKVIAFDARGAIAAEGRAPIPLANPEPEAWQQNPEDWWRALCESSRACLSSLDPTRPAALCIASQRETFALTDGSARALHPALVWMDHRCAGQVHEAVNKLGFERLHALSGKPPHTTPSLYKLLGLLARSPDIAGRIGRFVEVHGLLCWKLTDRSVTSLAAADPTGLVDMRQRRWSPELCALAGLGADQLPALVEPGKEIGRVTAAAAEQTGLPRDLPVIAGAGDGQSAGLGAGIVAPGTAYLNLGTAVVCGVLSREYRRSLTFRTLYGALPQTFFLETDLQGGTFTITWLCERLLGKSLQIIADLETDSSVIPPGAGDLMLVPYWNGVMSPYWDDKASGIVVGWRGHHGPAHLYRAVLEGIAFEQRLALEGVEAEVGPIGEIRVMGGGSQSALWCQILADVLGKPIVRAANSEATALGAAVLAAAAVGLHPSIEAAAAAMCHMAERFEPGANAARYRELFEQRYRHLYPSLRAILNRS